LALSARTEALVAPAPSASRALSLPTLKDRGSVKAMQMTINDRLEHSMAEPFR
jgi:hypothetical protein